MKKSTLLHLRVPFSFFLLPVFLLALAVSGEVDAMNGVLVFLILHLLVYPASNGYNSYFDRDEKSIGGLKNPPPVSLQLYYVSLFLDLLALMLAYIISLEFTVIILIYGLVSKAYSHPGIRLKKLPVTGLLAAGIFQGYFTYLMSFSALKGMSVFETFAPDIQIPGILSSVMLLGSYPMTQIYQHEEDEKRGDLTFSRLLGIKRTFQFTAIMFTLAVVGFIHYFLSKNLNSLAIYYLILLAPVLVFFLWWYWNYIKGNAEASHTLTMRLNLISSTCLNIFFLIWWIS